MSYIILKGVWCHIIVLNVHAAIEDKIDDVKDSFYEELKRVFDSTRIIAHENSVRKFQSQCRQEDILSRQLGMKVYTKLIMIMELG
jgi:hypothetical protein